MSVDLCVVSEGGFPIATGGLSRWVEVFCEMIVGAEVAVVSIGKPQGHVVFDVPDSVVALERSEWLPRRVPEAFMYVVSGPLLVEWADRYPHLLRKTIYVEHGDQLREYYEGSARCEAGGRLTVSRLRALMKLRDQAASHCRQVVGVHRRTAVRLRARQCTSALTIENACRPVGKAAQVRPNSVGFVGRPCRVKGIDRVKALERELKDLDFYSRGSSEFVAEQMPDAWEGTSSDPWLETPALVIMPSRCESSPFVALEAEARGVNVLMTPGAELSDSPLFHRLKWGRSWVDEVKRLSLHTPYPRQGQELAERRWRNFSNRWNAVLNGRFGDANCISA